MITHDGCNLMVRARWSEHDDRRMIHADDVLARAAVRPEVALILGSGLGALAETVEDAHVIPTSDVAGHPTSSVEGHEGRIVVGKLEGVPVVMIQGRVHLYEGHGASAITFSVRFARELGARKLLLTNAAGGIHPNLEPGSIMFITDHLNLVGAIPVGRATETAARVRGATTPYDEDLIDRAERCAAELEIPTSRGVYLWTRGPSYETKAEIAAFRRLGADAVGMSTVPEALQGAALGMKVLGISTITNRAAGLSASPLAHNDVLRVGRRVAVDLERLVRRLLQDES